MFACSETEPNFLASLIAKFPLVCYFAILLLIILIAAPAVAIPSLRPELNSDFGSLQVKDDPVASDVAAVKTLKDYNDIFWRTETAELRRQAQEQAALQRGGAPDGGFSRRLLSAPAGDGVDGLDSEVATGGAAMSVATPRRGRRGVLHVGSPHIDPVLSAAMRADIAAAERTYRPMLRALMQDGGGDGGGGGGEESDGAATVGSGGRPRQDISDARMLNIFYRYADNTTAITDSLTRFVRT